MSQSSHVITLLPGDGIGPEITAAVVDIIAATGVKITWEEHIAGKAALDKMGDPLPESVLDSIKKNKVALKGPLTTEVGKGFKSVNVQLRKSLNLYANLRPTKTIPGARARYTGVDIIVVRENTEDLYAGIENEIAPGVIQASKIITREASTRIAKFAFEYARVHHRKKVSAIHKANIMKLADGLFLKCCQEVAQDYPDIQYNEVIVDNCCMQLVTNPTQFDVMVLENLYGDIVSDLCAGLVGGLGVVPGANIGTEASVFEAVHGSAPDIAGKGIANPTAMLLSAVMMLQHIAEDHAAERILSAVYRVLGEGKVLTPDLRGDATTRQFTDEIIKFIN
ncbi:MAG: isocitrate dehydrogenase [[Candidatus Thermochlorobacteriaceae] bacterium GBChlB]|nr:MAG: isocitrate dehydrogenase [[Candidatus Thermochlorobacteriaceae] bacterium GBChlB]